MAALWILLSDRAARLVTADPAMIERISMIKGWLFVAVTATLLYLALRKQLARVEREASAHQKAARALAEAEERQRFFIEHAPAALAMFDREMRYLAVSRRWSTAFSLAGEELVGRRHYEVFPHLPERLKEAHRRGLAGEVVSAKADPYERADGTTQWLQWEVRPWRTAEDAVGGIMIFIEDITERIAAEGALRESEARFRSVVEGAPLAIFLQADGRFAYLNAAALALFGAKTAAELVGQPVLDRFHPADHPVVLERIRRLNQERRAVPATEEHLVRCDGTVADAEVTGVPFRVDDKAGALVFAHDITAQKLAHEQLRLQETVLRETSEIAKVGGWSFDPATGEGIWTDQVARIHGLDPGDKTSVSRGVSFYSGESRRRIEAALKAAVEQRQSYDLVLELVTAADVHKWVRTIGHPIVEGDKVVRVRGAFQDVTELYEATAALRESEERLKLFIEHAPAALAMFDRAMCYLTESRRWRDDYGLGDRPLTGLCHYEVFPEIGEEWKAIHRRALAGETIRADEDRFLRADGSVQWLTWEVRPWNDANGTIGGIVVFSEDITGRKAAESALALSEQGFRRLYDTMTQGVVYQDATGRITAMNPAAIRILGRTPEEFIGESSVSVERGTVREDGTLFPGLDHPSMVALRTGQEVGGVVMGIYNPRERQRRWISVSAVPLFVSGQTAPNEVYTIFEDVTERKRVEEQVRYHESLLRETGRIAQVGGWSFDVATGTGFWTEEVARIHGLDPTVPSCRDFGLQFYRPASRAQIEAAIRAAIEQGTSYDLELEICTAGGEVKWVRTIGHPQLEQGQVVRLFGSFQDITSRKRSEFAAAIQREVLELIARGAPLAATLKRLLELVEAQAQDCICAIMLTDPAGQCLRMGGSISLPEEYNRLVDGIPIGEGQGSCGTAAARGEPVLVDDITSDPLWTNYRSLAARFGLHACWSFPIMAERHQVLGTFAVYGRGRGAIPVEMRQLIEASTHTAAIAVSRLRDEAARRESEARFRELAETINEVFWINDPATGRQLYVSPAYERIWGASCASLYASPGAWMRSIQAEEDRPRVATAFARLPATGEYNETYRILRPDGGIRWIHDRGFPVRDEAGQVVRLVGVAEDITEKKRIETQFLRAQRLEAIGALAGGVAHDLNNILTPMLMATSLLEDEMVETHEQELLSMIEQSARRGADIVRQLLAFSRGVEGQRIVLQPRHLIKEMAAIIRETFPREITLSEDIAGDLWPVEADSTQLHQVLMNLCVNARDAMPRGGRLTLEARNLQLEPGDHQVSVECKPGPYIVILVTDTGEGMTAETITRIFEPFFTTKGVGKGTGLGLSTVMGIVRSHGGHVGVYSEPGRGSQFRVFLPAQPGRVIAPPATPAAVDKGNGELILVVDDEPSIRDATRRLLELRGYRVLTAQNGEEALKLVIQHRDNLRLVLTDVMMPVMGGIALARSLQTLDAGIPVVATSGLDEEDKRQELAGVGVQEVLAKPCASGDLTAAIRRQLDGRK